MAEMLSGFGRDVPKPQAPRATSGGPTTARDVRNYQPPVGPRGIETNSPVGLGGSNYGHDQKVSSPVEYGRPVQGVTNYGNGGSQGRR